MRVDPGEQVGAGAQIGAGARLRGRGACAAACAAASGAAPNPALADLPGNQNGTPFSDALAALGQYETALALTLGVILSRRHCHHVAGTRARAQRSETEARAEIVALKTELDRTYTLLLSEPAVIVVWTAAARNPTFSATLDRDSRPVARRALAFGTWLEL